MAYRVWILAGIVALALAAPAQAQPLIILPDHVTLGGSLARSDNADDNSGDHSPDVAATLELPLRQPVRLRFGVGRVAWRFGGRTADRSSPADTVSLTRATVSLIKMVVPPRVGDRLGAYVGGGVGIYHYGFRHGSGAVPTRKGVHALAGLECPLPNNRVVVGADWQLHIVRGPNDSPVQATELLVLQTSLHIRYRF